MTALHAARRAGFVASLLLAGSAIPAAAQGLLTADSLNAIRTDVRLLSAAIRNLVVQDINDLQPRARELVGAYRDHNSEPCEYLQGQPEMCEQYDAERHLLDARREKLQKELKAADSTTQEFEVRFVLLMERLKAGRFAADVARLRPAVLACAALPRPGDASACLAQAMPAVAPRRAGRGGR